MFELLSPSSSRLSFFFFFFLQSENKRTSQIPSTLDKFESSWMNDQNGARMKKTVLFIREHVQICCVILIQRGAGMAQCGPGLTREVDAMCGFLLLVLVLAPRVFFRLLRFFSLHKNQHFQIPIRPENSGRRTTLWMCH